MFFWNVFCTAINHAIEFMFKNRKNRSFNYKPRYSNTEENNSNIKPSSNRFEGKRKRKASTLPILIVVLALIIIFMYYLETKIT